MLQTDGVHGRWFQQVKRAPGRIQPEPLCPQVRNGRATKEPSSSPFASTGNVTETVAPTLRRRR
jgi:hypothetical protein